MGKFNKHNFIIKKDTNGTFQVLKKEYIFNLIPIWKELSYIENNNEFTFKFADILNAQQFISEICD